VGSPSPGRAPSSLFAPLSTRQTKNRRPQYRCTRRAPISPENGTGGIRVTTSRHETRGAPKGRDKALIGEPPGLAWDGPR